MTRMFTAADWLKAEMSVGLTDADLHDEEDDILDTEPLPTDDAAPWQARQRLTVADWRELIVATIVILLLGVVLVWVSFPDNPNEALTAMMEKMSTGAIVLYAWAAIVLPGVVIVWVVILCFNTIFLK